ncbi:MAG: DUF4352 domain-containing protein [Thermoleophilia bacterium]
MTGLLLTGCGDDSDVTPGDAQLGALEIRYSVAVTELTCPIDTDDDIASPASGMQYARLMVEVTNESSQELIVSPANLQLEATDGARYDFDLEYEDADILPTVVTISPGASVTGAVVFQLPLDAEPAALIEEFRGRQTRVELPAASD